MSFHGNPLHRPFDNHFARSKIGLFKGSIAQRSSLPSALAHIQQTHARVRRFGVNQRTKKSIFTEATCSHRRQGKHLFIIFKKTYWDMGYSWLSRTLDRSTRLCCGVGWIEVQARFSRNPLFSAIWPIVWIETKTHIFPDDPPAQGQASPLALAQLKQTHARVRRPR